MCPTPVANGQSAPTCRGLHSGGAPQAPVSFISELVERAGFPVITLSDLLVLTSKLFGIRLIAMALCISANISTVLQAQGRFIYRFSKGLVNSYQRDINIGMY